MAAGQVFGEELYTIMSNAGILIFIITILCCMVEVDKDMVATHDVACFLVSVGKKGDEIRIVDPAPITLPVQPQLEVHEEEKRQDDEDDETGAGGFEQEMNGIEVEEGGENDVSPSGESKEDERIKDVLEQETEPQPTVMITQTKKGGNHENAGSAENNHDEEKGSSVLENKAVDTVEPDLSEKKDDSIVANGEDDAMISGA